MSKNRVDTWWKSGSIYAIFLSSYSEAILGSYPGYGDIQGLTRKLPYIKERGFDVVWISLPVDQAFFYPANEVENYTRVDPKHGDLADFDSLIKELKKKGMKIIMDLEINHSSEEHLWFMDSSYKKKGYEDLYVWHPGHDGKPPNNWTTVYGTSAWTFDKIRKEYFFHQFRNRTADFNYRNPDALKMMKDVFVFWLERGVDGIHIPNTEYLLEESDFSDINYDNPVQNRIKNRRESYTDVIKPLRNVVKDHGGTLFISADSSPDASIIRQSADVIFNRDFIRKLSRISTCRDFLAVRQIMTDFYGKDSWPLWMSGTWDHSRLKSRLASLADGIQVIQFLMRGTPVTYYGEEIGMEDMDIDFDSTRDPAAKDAGPEKYRTVSRDPFRTPMQWNSVNNAGFTNHSQSYLPISPNILTVNVEHQLQSNTSLLRRVDRLNQLRKEFLEAKQTNPECRNEILYFERKYADQLLAVFVNFGQAQRFPLETVGIGKNRFRVEVSVRTSVQQSYADLEQHGLLVLRFAVTLL